MGIIYKTTNLINGKWYIGKDEKNNPNYLGSGILLTKAVKKYGKENFKKEILEECNDSRQILANLEKRIIADTNAVADTMAYNIAEGGSGGHNWGNYPEDQQAAIKLKMKKTDTEKESKRIFSIKNNLSKHMIDGRTEGRKAWWAALSEAERSGYQSKRSMGWWDKKSEEEQVVMRAKRSINSKQHYENLSEDEKIIRAAHHSEQISRVCKITSPAGEIIITNKLRKISKEIGVSYNSLNISIKENRTVKGGWMCEVLNVNT